MAWCEASLDIPRSLLEHGVDVDAHDYKHGTCRTPLHLASRGRNLGAVRFLLEHGANVDVRKRNDKGPAPLYQTMDNGHIPYIVRCMSISRSSDPY